MFSHLEVAATTAAGTWRLMAGLHYKPHTVTQYGFQSQALLLKRQTIISSLPRSLPVLFDTQQTLPPASKFLYHRLAFCPHSPFFQNCLSVSSPLAPWKALPQCLLIPINIPRFIPCPSPASPRAGYNNGKLKIKNG